MKIAVVVLSTLLIVGAVAWARIESHEADRAKAYFCGYARGMKFVSDQRGLNIGPVPDAMKCGPFDDLEAMMTARAARGK